MRFNSVYLFATGILNATFGHTQTTNSSASALRTCTLLQSSLGPEIVQLSGAEYLASASNSWSLFNAGNKPTCIIFPEETSHVQVAMASIFRDKIHYAVQAGGHTAMTGWNTVQDGILFFFSHMKNVSYDATKDTITLQPGIHWGEALTALEPLGVAPLGGRLGDVGTGLLLGGGLSYLSGEYGFSSDAYVELDVVLVTGQLVTANATNEFSDLFRALKGGANRFGIVTRYEVQAIHTGTNDDKNWFGGLILYPNSSAEALINATHRYVTTVNDPRASILMAFSSTINGTDIVPSHILTLFFRGSALPPAIFGEFLSIPSTFQQLSAVSYLEANNILGDGSDRGFGQLFGASVFNGTVDQYMNAFRAWSEYTASIKDSLFGTVLAFTPIQKSQILAGRARGSNIMDPPLENYAAVQIQTQTQSGLLRLSAEVDSARQTLFNSIPPSPGLPLYINECDAQQNVFATYGRYNELRNTYAKYDPTRFNVGYTEGPIGL
ncbi:putative FAD-linked oxidoreductase [Psilocybe cubensis]|uniref:FAD-linked oxidoreductase n=1 Tax=Psilocybe cubensis TaxID=181762 RepID=A0ACB8GL67_PSICU|nr:putative FAD-linked oxidoreductase [Psilocybe cubensis]KAH9476278.1 putative FAD-linked oxidoreductase [Psilocybe cubensis]